jgi:phosphonate transport system substrate-binding protein
MKRWPVLTTALILVILLSLLLAACGGPSTPTPTPLPTATATPRSTPLPPVPTAIPLGSEDNPLTILMVPQGTRRQATGSDDALADLILELTGLNVNVELADSDGAIVSQLCSADPVVGWLGGVAYMVAEAQGCADPALAIRRENATGFRVDLLIQTEITGDAVTESDVAALADKTLCRLGSDDVLTWLVPSLMLRSAGIDPLYGLDGVLDVEDYDAIAAGIYNGDCQAGAVPYRTFPNRLGSALRSLEDLRDKVAVVESSPEIPYGVMVYPQTVPLNVRIPLTDVFFQIASNSEQAATLQPILEQDSLVRVQPDDFDTLRGFMGATGLDFTALGE